jgi:hypothetical protein
VCRYEPGLYGTVATSLFSSNFIQFHTFADLYVKLNGFQPCKFREWIDMEKPTQWQMKIPAKKGKSQYLQLMLEMRERWARQLEARELDIQIKEMHAHSHGVFVYNWKHR